MEVRFDMDGDGGVPGELDRIAAVEAIKGAGSMGPKKENIIDET